MNDPLLVGITGGIGSGKSTVARIFAILGVPVYDADTRAREIVNENPDLRDRIIDLLGPDAFKDNVYDRSWVASRVFSSPEILSNLNALIHPSVQVDFKEWCQTHLDTPYVLKEAALLFESGSYKNLDHTILVKAPLEVRIERVLGRDSQRERADVERIISNQWSDEDKAKLSGGTINNGPEDLLIPQVLALHQLFLG